MLLHLEKLPKKRMKTRNYLLALCALIFSAAAGYAQLGTTVSVQGNLILGPCGDTLLLRGVNYAPYNWGYSPNQLNIAEIAQSGANCVRLPWYKNPQSGAPATTYGDLVNLDSVLSKCIQSQLIPIIELHDLTCQNDPVALIALADWYVQPDVLALIDKYKHSVIVNIANEALYVNWTADPSAAQTTYIDTYTTIAQSLRAAGITTPIMIDGPECGTNLDLLATVGATLQQNDPQHNLIFSAHAYWYAFAANDSATMVTKIDNAIASGMPFILGEIANQQDDQVMCQYNLNYQALLRICQTRNVNWLAWSWDNDGCPDRQITTNGSFSSLTPYGDDLLNNIDYGIHNFSPARSLYLFNGGSCNLPTALNEVAASTMQMHPNPSTGSFTLTLGGKVGQGTLRVTDLAGQLVHVQTFVDAQELKVQLDAAAGMYFATISVDDAILYTAKLMLR